MGDLSRATGIFALGPPTTPSWAPGVRVNDAIRYNHVSSQGVNSSFSQDTLPELYGALDNLRAPRKPLGVPRRALPHHRSDKAITRGSSTTRLSELPDRPFGHRGLANEMSSTLDNVTPGPLSAIQSSGDT